MINKIILQNIEVSTQILPYNDACEVGAVSLFGEKYSDIVRVVDVPGFSKELCGGTHVHRTGDIGGFKIISETSLAAGIRRMTAVTGESILELITSQCSMIQDIRNKLKCSQEEIQERLNALLEERKKLVKLNQNLQRTRQASQINDLVHSADKVGDLRLIVQKLDATGDLKEMGDQFRETFQGGGVALIGTIHDNKPIIMCVVTDDLTDKIQAGKIVQEVGSLMGGGGGGKPHIAIAGGKNIDSLDDALEKGKELIHALMT